MRKNKTSLVSVIVTTRNEERNISTCLESIRNQTYKNIEIIVVDNNSIDKTTQIASNFTNLIFTQGPERSAQRNFGADVSKGDFLLFLDADMKLSKDVVMDCVKNIEYTKAGAVIIPEESYGAGFWAKCKNLERSYYHGVDWIEAARFFDKKIFSEVGGFDKKLISGEDWDFSERVKQKSPIVRIESLIYHNEGNLTLYQTLQKKYYYSTKFSSYMKKNHDTINKTKQVNPIIRYKLFFSDYKKIISHPIVFIGMIFMKTCEFSVGFVGMYIK